MNPPDDQADSLAELYFLHEMLKDFAATLDLAQVLSHVLDSACALLGTEGSFIYLYEPSEGGLVLRGQQGPAWGWVAKTKPTEGILGQVATARQPQVMAPGDWAGLSQEQNLSGILTPLSSQEHVLGVLGIATAMSRSFRQAEVHRFLALANLASLAIENARLHESMQRLTVTDGLTGLYNRRYLDQQLARDFHRAVRYGHTLSLAMIDIDGFKAHNDVYGHLVGDEVLRTLGSIVRSGLRDVDTATRYGGEEFVLILPETAVRGAFAMGKRLQETVGDKTSAVSLAERIREAVEKTAFPGSPGRPPPQVTVRIGVDELAPKVKTPTDLLSRADQALYKAKQTGKNKVCVYWEEET